MHTKQNLIFPEEPDETKESIEEAEGIEEVTEDTPEESKAITPSPPNPLQKVGQSFKQIGQWFQRNWERTKRGIVDYIKSRARNFPTILPKPRRRVVDQITRGSVFHTAIEQFARETGMPPEEFHEKGRQYVKEIASDLNYLSFPFWDAILSWVFNKIYDGIVVDEKSLEKLKGKIGQAPIVFVPNHRSHIDYLLLSYVFYCHQIPMPYICAGNNMNFWPVGPMFRKSGAFFIRRSFEGNRLYQAALYSYLHYLLKEKAIIKFFIEGTRSRTGKLLAPKLGILSLLVKAFDQQDDIKDILFVPTSIVYESVIEEHSYTDESEGATKKKESLWDILRIRKHLRGRYGKVYIRFGNPISLAEFSRTKLLEEGESDISITIPWLANEMGHIINRNSVVTPTSLLAMSVLTHPHSVMTEDEIEERFSRLKSYLEYKKAPISDLIIKHPKESIEVALQKFTSSRHLRRYKDEEGIFYRIPHNRRKTLEFYKNTGVHFFVSASTIANALLAMETPLISKESIEEEIIFLRELFYDEYRFGSSRTLWEHIETVLNFFVKREMIYPENAHYRLNPNRRPLEEFAALLNSTFSFYWGLLKVLTLLPTNESFLESDLIPRLLDRIRLQLMRHHISRNEAISPFAIRSTLLTCLRFGFLRLDKEIVGRRERRRYCKTDNVQLEPFVKRLEKYI